MYEGGIANMRYSISNTAEYGDYTRGPRIIDENVKKQMKNVLNEIQTGQFVKEWMLENKVSQTSFQSIRAREADHHIEAVGSKLREMMPWISENKLVDKEKN